ncbi:MAG: DUF2812 domain-containing protein [Coriobacteriales bacterium]|jgi:hypothetical protein|nr:DUF2812 domain-containing protein [Coriobacteriales bacterium]
MRVFKTFVDIDKEEAYLRAMAQKGQQLVRYTSYGVYIFRAAEPAPLNYRVDYRIFTGKEQFEEYLTLFADAGWEHVCGSWQSGSQYFLPRPGTVQTEDIFSDEESRAARYKRFGQFNLSFALLCGLWALALPVLWGYISGLPSADFHDWYLTPELWELSGLRFWRAFLLETPFALMRVGFIPLIELVLLALTALTGYWACRAWWLYRQHKRQW